jgi:hypothetical protein
MRYPAMYPDSTPASTVPQWNLKEQNSLIFQGVMGSIEMSVEVLGIVNGGRGGIRTPDTLSGTPVFKTGAINHSATLPV